MWILANTGLSQALPSITLAAATSHQALNIRLPQLDRMLSRALEKLQSYQTRPASVQLLECQRLATTVLNPGEADEEKQAIKTALDHWYLDDFCPFLEAFNATAHKGATIQERLAVKLGEVIAAFRTKVFTKPYSDPPDDHPSVVSHDLSRRPTVPEVKIRPPRDQASARLLGDTLRSVNQIESVEMEWREDGKDTAKPAERRAQNAAFYGMVEEALARHPGMHLIIFLDRDWQAMRGMTTLLWIELFRRQKQAAQWLGSRHIEVVSRLDKASCRITYDQEQQKILISSPLPFNPQTGRA